MEFPQELLLPQKTIFKKRSSLNIPEECKAFGPRGLIVHGSSLEKNGKKQEIADCFHDESKIGFFCRAKGEPTLEEIEAVIEKGKEIKADWIAGIGGGSVLDLAKAAAGLFNASRKPVFYQEGGKLEQYGIPFVAVPTTAGTGSEATINSVIINPDKKTKLSIRDKTFLARKVILDVELLRGVPPSIMRFAAMDALVQAYESFISRNATWFSDSLSLKAIELINGNIVPAYRMAAEENMSRLLLGSYLAGVALASSRLGVIHGVAHPLGVLYGIPHGHICAVCFVPSIKINKKTIGRKYKIISDIIGLDFLERAEELLNSLEIVSQFKGKELIDKENIITATLKSGSTAANPKDINREDVEFILNEIF